MPLVQRTDGQPAVKPYGVQPSNNTMTLQERLMKRFAAHEFVTVRNVDDERLVWQYLPAHAEDYEYTSDPMKITRREMPELWEMQPGDTEVLVGANAYLMIDVLYKKIVAKKRFSDTPDDPTQTLSFNFSDGDQQEKLIDQIFIGKASPTFNVPQPAPDRDETYEQKVIEAERSKKVGVTGGTR